MKQARFMFVMGVVAVLLVGVGTAKAAVLLDDNFDQTYNAPIDPTKWTDNTGDWYRQQFPFASHAGFNSWGTFQSIQTFGSGLGPITVDFLGLRPQATATSGDITWGLWDWDGGENGVGFRWNMFTQNIQVLVGTSIINPTTPLSIAPWTAYNMEIVWTPGSEVQFYGGLASSAMSLLYSTTTGVPLTARPVQVYSETGFLDFDRITLSAPLPEPGTLALMGLGGLLLVWRRRKRE